MRLKTYTAPSIQQAMEMIRRDLGEDAIIVSTQGERGRQGARVTAAVEDPEPQPPDRAGEALAMSIERALRFHGLPATLADHLRDEAAGYRAEGQVMALSAALDGLIDFQPLCERRQQRPILLLGAPGAGKTVTAAKLIVRACRAARPVLALSTDSERAGGVEQLEAFLRLLPLPLATVVDPPQLAAALADGGPGRLAVIDTAGANLFDPASRAWLGDLVAAAAAEPVLVMAAGGDIADAIEAGEHAAALGCQRMIVTRVDSVRRLGAMVATAEATGLALADVGISPQVSDGLIPLNPVSLARLLLPEAEAGATP